jgi:hypothetical protein
MLNVAIFMGGGSKGDAGLCAALEVPRVGHHVRAIKTVTLPERYRTLLTLARLLDHLERQPAPPADQYRSVVQHLNLELAAIPPGEELDMLLQAFPATAELYENLQYAHAGLVRSDLDRSLQAELQARELIRNVSR